MSVQAQRGELESAIPEPEFAITSAAPLAFAAGPTMVFTAEATEPSGCEVQSMALSVQVMIDPARRGYDADTRGRLAELFGPPAGWTPSTQGLSWARLAAQVTAFSGSTTFSLEVPCTYDGLGEVTRVRVTDEHDGAFGASDKPRAMLILLSAS